MVNGVFTDSLAKMRKNACGAARDLWRDLGAAGSDGCIVGNGSVYVTHDVLSGNWDLGSEIA
jgi:hypothetical protein